MKIFRFTGPLYYANSAYFLSEIYKKTALNPAELKKVNFQKVDVVFDEMFGGLMSMIMFVMSCPTC